MFGEEYPMANRHAHKKLRAEIRARMALTGETYQQAQTRLRVPRPSLAWPRTDLVATAYHGLPATIATIEMHGMAVAFLLPSSHLWPHGAPLTSPIPMLRAWMRRTGVQ
jgi:hypothetical protein